MISTPSRARITNPSTSPSGTSAVLLKPNRSIQKGRQGSMASTISTGVSRFIFMSGAPVQRFARKVIAFGCRVLYETDKLPLLRIGSWRCTGQSLKLIAEMRLVGVATERRDARERVPRFAEKESERVAEARDAERLLGRKTHPGFEASLQRALAAPKLM